MAKLAIFYSRADENYFGGAYRYITVGIYLGYPNYWGTMPMAVYTPIGRAKQFIRFVPTRAAD